MKGVCCDCKWHNNYTGVCYCGDSDHRADFTDAMFGCEHYEAIECTECQFYNGHECEAPDE